jgi:hypothetical protein
MLCGTWGGKTQWGSGTGDARDDIRLRQSQNQLARHILQHYGLELRPWRGEGYLVDNGGRSPQHVKDLSALWSAVERVTGKKCDPLAPDLVEFLLDSRQ